MNIEELMLERYGIKKQFCFSGVVFAGIVKNCRNIASMALIKFPPANRHLETRQCVSERIHRI